MLPESLFVLDGVMQRMEVIGRRMREMGVRRVTAPSKPSPPRKPPHPTSKQLDLAERKSWLKLYSPKHTNPKKRRIRQASPPRRRRSQSSTNRILLLALQAASLIAHEQPEITLNQGICRRQSLQRYRGYMGLLNTSKFETESEDMQRLRKTLEEMPQGLLTSTDSFQLIVDSGCTLSSTPDPLDFIPGTLQPLIHPVRMDGIAGGLTVTKSGTVRYEIIDDRGDVHPLEMQAYYLPQLKTRLLSPQAFLKSNESSLGSKACFSLYADRAVLNLGGGECAEVSIPYDSTTHLPILRAYRNALSTANALTLKGCVSEETNQNLTFRQRLLLRFHFRLGHLSFGHTQWLGRQGWLGPQGSKMGHGTIEPPKCATCQFGKQSKTPDGSTTQVKQKSGNLKVNKLAPGELIFTDQ